MYLVRFDFAQVGALVDFFPQSGLLAERESSCLWGLVLLALSKRLGCYLNSSNLLSCYCEDFQLIIHYCPSLASLLYCHLRLVSKTVTIEHL